MSNNKLKTETIIFIIFILIIVISVLSGCVNGTDNMWGHVGPTNEIRKVFPIHLPGRNN